MNDKLQRTINTLYKTLTGKYAKNIAMFFWLLSMCTLDRAIQSVSRKNFYYIHILGNIVFVILFNIVFWSIYKLLKDEP